MKGFITNIEKDSLENENFRKVIYTAHYSQLVLMSLKPGEDIGEEVHGLDQFLRIEKGTGKTILNGIEYPLEDGSAIVVPAGTMHNIINTSATEEMKLYTVYSIPNHQKDTLHPTKADAEAHEEHFDGITTETE